MRVHADNLEVSLVFDFWPCGAELDGRKLAKAVMHALKERPWNRNVQFGVIHAYRENGHPVVTASLVANGSQLHALGKYLASIGGDLVTKHVDTLMGARYVDTRLVAQTATGLYRNRTVD